MSEHRWHRDPIINALAERIALGELESQQPTALAAAALGQDAEERLDAKHGKAAREAGNAQGTAHEK